MNCMKNRRILNMFINFLTVLCLHVSFLVSLGIVIYRFTTILPIFKYCSLYRLHRRQFTTHHQKAFICQCITKTIFLSMHITKNHFSINPHNKKVFFYQWISIKSTFLSMHITKKYFPINAQHQKVSSYQFISLKRLFLSLHTTKKYVSINAHHQKALFYQCLSPKSAYHW